MCGKVNLLYGNIALHQHVLESEDGKLRTINIMSLMAYIVDLLIDHFLRRHTFMSVPFPMENAEMAVFLTGSMVSLSIFAAMILPICIIPDAFMNRSINRLKDCYSKTMVLSLVYSWRTNMSMLPVPGK